MIKTKKNKSTNQTTILHMGFDIEYQFKLRINVSDVQKTIDIFNNLHTDTMLQKYAREGIFKRGNLFQYKYFTAEMKAKFDKEIEKDFNSLPIREKKGYCFVQNPEKPYKRIDEAFLNWPFSNKKLEMCMITNYLLIEGSHKGKYGQQDFLLEQLAPVLHDTKIEVKGENGEKIYWIIENHKFSSQNDSPLKEYCNLAQQIDETLFANPNINGNTFPFKPF